MVLADDIYVYLPRKSSLKGRKILNCICALEGVVKNGNLRFFFYLKFSNLGRDGCF